MTADPDDDTLRAVYEAHRPTRPRWPNLETMLADAVLRHVLVALARHCPRPTAEAVKRAGIVAAPVTPWAPVTRRPLTPFMDQKSKAAGERED